MTGIQLYDTTLRDGAQREGISLSAEDKLKIARKLDELGIHYVEGGWPGSNPKDAEFFLRAQSLPLTQAVIVAFGSTRRAGTRPQEDTNLQAMLAAGTRAVALVGKSWDLHVTQVLRTTLEENLRMIADSVAFMKTQGREVVFDAEHFFDGFKAHPDYALATVRAAADAGATCVVLCDTNGGGLPEEIGTICARVRREVDVRVGIHTHNDGELAVAGTLSAVRAGATHVQGTINGYGERCGNANLCSIIPNLQLKMGLRCLSEEQLARLTDVSHYVSEIANLLSDPHLPYVGRSAFAHKGGIHVSAVLRVEESYQHIDPTLVGNTKRVVVSELSGQGNIIYKSQELGIKLPKTGQAKTILEQIKNLESRGFQFEGAEASFELLLHRAQEDYQPPFELVDFLVVIEKRRRAPTHGNGDGMLAEAMVKVRIEGQIFHTAAEGNGPVNALDAALRKALVEFYPSISAVRLVDYKVRVLDEDHGTAATIRVLIESTDGKQRWSTVGSSSNIIEASWLALADSLEYWLLREEVSCALKGRATHP